MATHGVVAAEAPLEARAGLRVRESGGNAFDAAVAVFYMTGVVEQHQAGIGGDAFIGHLRADGNTYQVCLCNQETYRHWNYAIRPDIDSAGPSHGIQMDFTPHLQIRTVPSWFKRKRAPWKALVVARDSGAFRTRGRKPIQPGSSSCAHTIYRSPLEADHRAGANGAVIGNDSPVGKFQAEEALVQLSDAYKLSVSLEAEGRSRS